VSASPDQIAANVATVRARLADVAADSGRRPDGIRLIAVSKRVDVAAIRAAIAAGIEDLGENYVQELREKAPQIEAPVRWHFIGALRSSTAHHVADLADVVHTVVGEHAARRLSGRAARGGRSLEVLLEVDFTGERAGLRPSDVPATADLVSTLEAVRLRGLMTIAPLTDDPEGARPAFRSLRQLRDGLLERHPEATELSMGMSLDYHVAVQEGATMVRIGTAVFGPRTP
jgi:pyridoxal phosphate enzyme (YggS family)